MIISDKKNSKFDFCLSTEDPIDQKINEMIYQDKHKDCYNESFGAAELKYQRGN